MKRYTVISYNSENNSHLNVQDLLPASCKKITGVVVLASAKQEGELVDLTELLPFPKALITSLLQKDSVTELFYSYLKTRESESDSRVYFETEMLPELISVLSNNIKYTCLSETAQKEFTEGLTNTFNAQFADYLYLDKSLFEMGQSLSNQEFAEFIALHTLKFAYLKRTDVFLRTQQRYVQPEPYECGNISLLVNGNNFLIRDYALTANRTIKSMNKEVIPLNEPLEVNSNIHTVFKSNKNSDNSILTIKIYIEYEH